MNNLLRGALMSLVLVFSMTNSVMAGDHTARSTVESANTAWNQALNSGNTKALAALYTKNATLSPGNGKALVGHTEIENLFKEFVKNGVHNHTLEIVNVGASGKFIYQVSKWNANGAETDGKTPSFGGITMSVMERGADGKWLIRSHVWNAGN